MVKMTVKVKHAGFNVNVRLELPWQDLNLLTNLICDDEYRINDLKKVIGDRVDTIIDIGGHIGGFGLLAKSLWPNAMLIAVEPVKLNCELYIKNLKDNNFWDENCHILQAAIGYNRKRTCIVNSPRSSGGFIMGTEDEAIRLIRERDRFYDRIIDKNVRVLTIENIFEMFGIEKIDLAKWDCEGGEVDAFYNMTDESAGKFRFMMGEYHMGEYHSCDSNSCYLKSGLFSLILFWRRVRRKFPHLHFNYEKHSGLNALGIFQAWPKEIN